MHFVDEHHLEPAQLTPATAGAFDAAVPSVDVAASGEFLPSVDVPAAVQHITDPHTETTH